MARLLLPGVQVLNVVDLPARDPYPATQLATLYQPSSGDVLRLTCINDAAGPLRAAEAPVVVEITGRLVDTGKGGRSFRLKVSAVAKSGGDWE